MATLTPQSSRSACDFSCLTIFDPVCASNGETFSSSCELNRTRCISGDDTLRIAAQGACVSSVRSSSGSGGVCLQEFACLAVYTPVCGSNGQTYSNECFLKRARCSDPTLTLSYNGECRGGSTEEAGTDARDTSSTSSENCVERPCTREFLPLCGSNGVTYSNKCIFQNAQCFNPSLTLAFEGPCTASVSPSGVENISSESKAGSAVISVVSSESASSDSYAASGSRRGFTLMLVALLATLAV